LTPPSFDIEKTLLHQVLVRSNELQRVPAALVLGLMLVNAVCVALVWTGSTSESLWAGGICLAAMLVNWLALRGLRQTGRSFGPDKPSAVALMLVFAVLGVLFALFRLPLWSYALCLSLITVTAIYATWIEPFRVGVTVEALSLPPERWNPDAPLRLLHLGDLHVERETARERRVNALITELQPDVIVFSGDFVNFSYTDDPQTLADIRRIIGAWNAPLGVYIVPGTPTVEPMPRIAEFLRGLDNLTPLFNRWTRVDAPGGTLHIAGMVTTHMPPEDEATLAQLGRDMPQDGVKLLLTHSPDSAPQAAALGFDLYVCGHTHGGQIRFPLIGALFYASHLGRRFGIGRHQVGNMTQYTTRGLGMEGMGAPRARLLCPPEIVLWRIGG
jgi:hypothetical protein